MSLPLHKSTPSPSAPRPPASGPGNHEPAACPRGRARPGHGSGTAHPVACAARGSPPASRVRGPSTPTPHGRASSRRAAPSRRLYPPFIGGRGPLPPCGRRGQAVRFHAAFSVLPGGHPGAASRAVICLVPLCPLAVWGVRCASAARPRALWGGRPPVPRPRPLAGRLGAAVPLRQPLPLSRGADGLPLEVTFPSPSPGAPSALRSAELHRPSLSAPTNKDFKFFKKIIKDS